MATKKKS